MNRLIVLACIAFLLCVFLNFNFSEYTAVAEDNTMLDYSQSPSLYRMEVAKLAASQNEEESLRNKDAFHRKASTKSSIVLIKTDGHIPEVSSIIPDRLIRGPRNRFTAMFYSQETALEYIHWLRQEPWVIYAEIDQGASGSSVQPAEINYVSWGAEKMGFAMMATYVQATEEEEKVVAIIDSGTCLHSLIENKISILGYDYVDCDSDPTNDTFGHGTAVAGIVADCTNAMPVYLMPIRVLNGAGNGSIANIVNAIDEAIENGVDIINLSLNSNTCQQSFHEAIRYAISSGVTVVVSAGNDGKDVVGVCPSHMDDEELIVVGSVESDGSISSYSNYGDTVDVYACGTDIKCCSISYSYKSATGTSMAAPHVTAACAAIKLVAPFVDVTDEIAYMKAVIESDMLGPPIISRLVPRNIASTATSLTLPVGTTIQLMDEVFPQTSIGDLVWSTDSPEVLQIIDGTLVCLCNGTGHLIATVNGLEITVLELSIVNDTWNSLPYALSEIEEEAFYGAADIDFLVLPPQLKHIGPSAFVSCENLTAIITPKSIETIAEDSFNNVDVVFVCEEGSYTEDYAINNGIPFFVGTLTS